MSRARDTANQINRVNSSAADATALTVDSSENVLVGKTTDAQQTAGTVLYPSGQIYNTASGTHPLVVTRKTNDGAIALFYKDTNEVGRIGSISGVDLFVAGSRGAGQRYLLNNILPCNASGDVVDNTIDFGQSNYRYKDAYLSGGIYLGGTGSANKLEDYEEGTWTPTLPNGGTVDTNIKSTYTKIGNFVTAYCYIAFTPTNNSSTLNIGGLPFTQTGTANHGGGSLSYTASQNVQHFSAPLVASSSNRIYFHRHDGNSSTIKNNEFGGNQRVFIVQVNYSIG